MSLKSLDNHPMLLARFPAVILAGGAASRMGGGDKPLALLQTKPILEWIIDRLRSQISKLAISANGDPTRFSGFPFPILPDHVPGLGPMAGILAAIVWARQVMPDATHVLTVPGDTPFLPLDLVDRLSASLPDHAFTMSAAMSGDRLHPTAALWPLAAQDSISQKLRAGDGQRVLNWFDELGGLSVQWSTVPYDPFFNVNSPNDKDEAERIATLYV